MLRRYRRAYSAGVWPVAGRSVRVVEAEAGGGLRVEAGERGRAEQRIERRRAETLVRMEAVDRIERGPTQASHGTGEHWVEVRVLAEAAHRRRTEAGRVTLQVLEQFVARVERLAAVDAARRPAADERPRLAGRGQARWVAAGEGRVEAERVCERIEAGVAR